MEEIIRLRFTERDKKFTEKLTTVKQGASASGLLNSGITVKNGHDALVEEFVESRKTIVSTFAEHLALKKPNKIDDSLISSAFEILNERRRFLENFYKEQMRAVASNLQNTSMIARFTTLDETKELNKKELEIELAKEKDAYLTSRGATLFERVKNQFLDRPMVVIIIITITAVTTTLSFLKLVGVL